MTNRPAPAAHPHAAHHAAKPPTQRQLRVGEEIRHLLAGIFTRREFRDPDLARAVVTVTEVRISPDLRHASVFVTRLGRSDIGVLLPNLARAGAYLRGVIAKQLRLRVAPELAFLPDTSIDYAQHVSQLLARPEVARDLNRPEIARDLDRPEVARDQDRP